MTDVNTKNRTDTCRCGAVVEPYAVNADYPAPQYMYRHCGRGWWNDDEGPDLSKPVVDCQVVDQIVTWTDKDHTPLVGVGDLVLENGEFTSVTRIWWNPATLRVKVWLSRYDYPFEVGPGAYVAVRRYVETSSQDSEEIGR